MLSRAGMAFNNRSDPYVSHSGTVRGFATHTSPALEVISGYDQYAHGHTTGFVKFYIRFIFFLFWQRKWVNREVQEEPQAWSQPTPDTRRKTNRDTD